MEVLEFGRLVGSASCVPGGIGVCANSSELAAIDDQIVVAMIPSSDCRPWRSDRSGSSGILVVSPSARPRLGTRSPWRLHQMDNVSPGWPACYAGQSGVRGRKASKSPSLRKDLAMPNPAVAERMFQPLFSGPLWVSPRAPHGPMSASLFRCRQSAGGSPRAHNLGAASSSASVLESRGVLTPRWRTRDARARERRSAMTVRPLRTGLPSGWRAYSGAPIAGASVEWSARGALRQPSLYPLTLLGPTWRTISSMSQRRMPISHNS
jgi:hypothetical protein